MAMERPFEKRFTTKLYDPRNLNGEPRKETFEWVRSFENALQDFPWFMGVDPFGSTMKGYATEHSDIDLWVLAEGDRDDLEMMTHIRKSTKERIKEKLGVIPKEIHWTLLFFEKERCRRCLRKGDVSSNDIFYVAHAFRRINGERIKRYRNEMVSELASLDEKKRELMVRRLATALSLEELCNWNKIEARCLHWGMDECENIVKSTRRQLWERRIRSFLGNPDQEDFLEEDFLEGNNSKESV